MQYVHSHSAHSRPRAGIAIPPLSVRKNRDEFATDLRQFCCRIHPEGTAMLKILLPVDGSPSAVRATELLIETIGWYREAPSIELISVHLPVPRVPNLA
jgi:hypothetical protein